MGEGAFVIEGYLNLVSQEGGYAGPDWELDGAPLAGMLVDAFGVEQLTWDSFKMEDSLGKGEPGDYPVGRVRITIERLETE